MRRYPQIKGDKRSCKVSTGFSLLRTLAKFEMATKNRNDVEKKYQNIKTKYRKMGLSDKEISDAFVHVFKTERSFNVNKKTFIVGFITIAVCAMVYHNWYLFTNNRVRLSMAHLPHARIDSFERYFIHFLIFSAG